jgi:PKD repeat protein
VTSLVTIAKETLALAATTTATTAPTAPTTKKVTATTAVPPVHLAANFNWDETGSGGDIHFTDTSTGTHTSWSWNFGDGGISTIRNPIHRYSKGASYSVMLTITRSTDGATSSITKPVTV